MMSSKLDQTFLTDEMKLHHHHQQPQAWSSPPPTTPPSAPPPTAARRSAVEQMPRLSVQHEFGNNLMVWGYARLLLRHFGDRVKFRLDMAISAAVSLIFVLSVVIVAVIAIGSSQSDHMNASDYK